MMRNAFRAVFGVILTVGALLVIGTGALADPVKLKAALPRPQELPGFTEVKFGLAEGDSTRSACSLIANRRDGLQIRVNVILFAAATEALGSARTQANRTSNGLGFPSGTFTGRSLGEKSWVSETETSRRGNTTLLVQDNRVLVRVDASYRADADDGTKAYHRVFGPAELQLVERCAETVLKRLSRHQYTKATRG